MADLAEAETLRYEFTGSLVRVVDFRVTDESGEEVGRMTEMPRRGLRRWLPLGRYDALARHECVLMNVADSPVLWVIRPGMVRRSRFDVLDGAKVGVARALQRGGFVPRRFDVSTPTGELLGVVESVGDGLFHLRTAAGSGVATLTVVSPRPATLPFRRPPIYELRFQDAATDALHLVGLAMAPGIHSVLFPRM